MEKKQSEGYFLMGLFTTLGVLSGALLVTLVVGVLVSIS